MLVSVKVSDPGYKKTETKTSVCCLSANIEVVDIQGVAE
jgi:hypothetical protein